MFPRRPVLPRVSPAGARAFTLAELLTVIAIVGILVAIVIPVVGRARDSADDVQCKTALRSWGTAIQLYVNDNKGMLPGPCWAVVQNTPGNNKQLPYFLVSYMDEALKKGRLPDNFLCAAWAREKTEDSAPLWQLVRVPKRTGGSGVRPFGYPQSGDSDPEPPFRYTTLDEIIDTKTAVALRDIDQGVASNAGLPGKPIHGNHRNVLFFDWHVGVQGAQ